VGTEPALPVRIGQVRLPAWIGLISTSR